MEGPIIRPVYKKLSIEKELNSVAIDAEINRDIVMPKILYDEYFKENPNKPIETIGNLYFESAILLKHYDKKTKSYN